VTTPQKKTVLTSFLLCFLAASATAAVRVFVQDTNGMAWIRYECTAGEIVRAFALDVTVDRGQILAVTNFFVGPSTAAARGYGIFPASFRDNIAVTSGTNANWNSPGYTPLAVPADNPAGTLPGLGSSGVTLEFGALWDPTVPSAIPPVSGALCALQISQPAKVSIAPNLIRGGIVGAPTDLPITPQFSGALVGPAITSVTFSNGVVLIRFQDGELESAPSLSGPWTGTGNSSGLYSESTTLAARKFYRVHNTSL
jgi:hypothetical protein